jgi:hypothetical protein
MQKPPNELLDSDALIDWLRQQPADEEYMWQDPVYCLMGRYLADKGSRWGAVHYSSMPGYYEIAMAKPWTFGAALERAEAQREERARITAAVARLAPKASTSRELVTVDAG